MKTLNLLLSYIPRPLPVGIKEFDVWANRIISISGKFADEDSMKWALATQVIHLDARAGSKPDQYFVKTLRKAAANQVASQIFQDIKIKQQAKAEETATAKPEVTPEASDEQKRISQT